MNIPLKKLSTYPAEILEVSHSTLNSYHSCPRKLEFAKLFKYNLRGRGTAGDAGNALHSAAGVYLQTKNKELAIWTLMFEYPIDLCSNPLWNWSLEATYAGLIQLMNYLDLHPELELAVIGDKQAVEVPFLINIHHNITDLMPVVYRGYIDFVFYDRLENKYKIVDLKGTTYDIKDIHAKWRWDSQCLPYALVLKRALDESVDSLDVEYLVTKVHLLESSIIPLEYYKSSDDIKEWTQDLLVDLMTINSYIQTQWFPRRSTSCIGFGKVCKFFDLCESRDLNTIKLMLSSKETKIEEKPFNPWITLDLEIA